jgi:membrane protease YdiL (CAAX protease family)
MFTRKEPRLRIPIYLALFVLFRDAMTPLGLWAFGSQAGFWIRMRGDAAFLVVMAIFSLAMSVGLYWGDRENRPLFQWIRGPALRGAAVGIAGAAVVVAPLALIYRQVPIIERGGAVPTALLPALFAATLLGNLFEEALFRGYVFGFLAQRMPPLKAGVVSGFVFAFCHVFLATTVTDVGYSLLVFTLWEGIVAGIVGAKCGVVPAAISHGGAIFLLSSGLM